MADTRLYTCSKCKKQVPMKYEVCPFCKTPRPATKKANEKKKHPILAAVAIILAISAIGSIIGSGSKDKETPKTSDPPASDSIQQSQPRQDPSSEPDSGKESELAYNVDWDKCLDDLKESVLNQEFFPYAKDVYVAVDEEKKQITFSAVVGDATDPSVALDYADTIVRQYNLMANMQDSNIVLGSKDYYGGLYDKYDILVGIAPQSKVDDSDQWFVYDASIAGAHKKFKLQKEYSINTVNIDTTMGILRTTLSQNFGENNYTLEYDDKAVTINLWGENIAVGATLAAAGDVDAKTAWASVVEGQKSLCNSIMEQIKTTGIDNYYVAINVLNDLDKDKTLLSILNGVVIYDATND